MRTRGVCVTNKATELSAKPKSFFSPVRGRSLASPWLHLESRMCSPHHPVLRPAYPDKQRTSDVQLLAAFVPHTEHIQESGGQYACCSPHYTRRGFVDLLTLFALTFSAISNHGGTGVWDCRAFAPIYTVHTTATVSHMVKTEPKVLAIWCFDIFDLRCSVWMSGIGEMSLWGALYMAAGSNHIRGTVSRS